MALFSERYDLVKKTKLQRNSLEACTRNLLWNQMFVMYCLYEDDFIQFSKYIWNSYLKNCMDEFPTCVNKYRETISDYTTFLKEIFIHGEYYRVYDILEIAADRFQNMDFVLYCNDVFEQENCAYRFVDKYITEITSDIEIHEVEDAANTNIKNVDVHIRQALEHLSDRQNPDYRNAIKESISAVEALCRNITGESTLDRALNKLENKGVVFNLQLKQGLEKIYYYTNGDDGIRHALMDETKPPTKADAKFMLVMCSAFINYIKEKEILEEEGDNKFSLNNSLKEGIKVEENDDCAC